MAIEFNCPHCAHAYRLKDELAGKTATCKTCRNKIVIPQPVTVPDDVPDLSAEEAAAKEAEALAALADQPTQAAEEATAALIPVECPHCNHKWTEARARAGKRALCPNPECRQLIKIPEPKDDKTLDWRQKNTKLPEGAKQNFEKLEGVQDAADLRHVGGQALRDADATGEEFEPRPLRQKVMFVLVPLAVLALTAFGIRSCYVGRIEGKEDRLMQEAQDEFAKGPAALPAGEAPPEVPLCTALLYAAAGEYAVRNDSPDKVKDALEQFARGRDAVRKAPPSLARTAVGGELAVAALVMGGTEQQARDQLRIRWSPDLAGTKVRVNERVFTILDELRQSLALVKDADFEFRNHLTRRLTRELMKHGQGQLAVELIPVALFNPPEQDEAKAVIALEILRADKASTIPADVARDLKARGAELVRGVPTPASAQTLFLMLDGDKPQRVVSPPTTDPVSDASRFAYVGKLLLDNQPDDALKLALRRGGLEGQVRALVLCADWSADPTAALDAAFGLAAANAKRKEVSPYSVLRLAQIAADKGKHDKARDFAKLIQDDGLEAWARGSAVRLRVAGSKDKADVEWAELPDDPKKLRAGHEWGRLWVARQNTRASGDRSAEVKAVAAWPAAAVPFGKAGVALGLQDRDK